MADGGFAHFAGQTKRALKHRFSSPFAYVPVDAEQRRHDAEFHLATTHPEDSCTQGVTPAQLRLLKKTGVVLGVIGMLMPDILVMLVTWLAFGVFAALVLFRVLLVVAGALHRPHLSDMSIRPIDRKEKTIWPVYTVMAAVYREPRAVEQLVAALKGLDYPKRQLDIQILIEESDTETYDALCALRLKPHFRIVPVPAGSIQTKPRALNYGLSLARGQYVCIYDAEDQMHAGQLKAAVRAFQGAGGEGLACVQAPLVPHNGRESWIARQFELEYLAHFGLIVPGLTALSLPVMLGGTSNHFRRDVLEKVGGWDPFNVTEDADLGLRLSRAGYRIGMIAPPTYEEAPVARKQWVGQRSRWIKGFIQSLGVFTRNPGRAIREMGALKWAAAMCLLGGSVLSAVMHGPLAIWLLVSAALPGVSVPASSVTLLLAGFGVHLVSSVLSWPDVKVSRIAGALTAPVYWPLQMFAAYKAIKELRTNPYFWDKTEHGVTEKELCRSKLRG